MAILNNQFENEQEKKVATAQIPQPAAGAVAFTTPQPQPVAEPIGIQQEEFEQITDVRSPEQRFQDLASELIPEGEVQDLSISGRVARLKGQQEEQKASFEATAAREQELQAIEQGRQEQQLERAGKSVSAFTGRGVGGTSVNATTPEAFRKIFEQDKRKITLRREAFDQSITEKRKQLEEAQKAQNTVLVGQRLEELNALELQKEQQDLKERQLSLDEANLQFGIQTQTERDKQTSFSNLLKTINQLPSSAVANLGADGIASLAGSLGAEIDPVLASGIASEMANIAELQKSSNELDRQLAETKLAEMQSSLLRSVTAPQTALDEQRVGLDSLLSSGIITQDEYKTRLRQVSGVDNQPSKKTTVKVGDDVYAFNPDTGESEKIVDSSGSNDIQPTGQIVSQTVAGRNVTLDSGAMAAFNFANTASVQAGVGEIKIGGTETSSTRDQSATIAGMVSHWNSQNPNEQILFDAARPNDSAAALRLKGIAVANVGASKHEHGMALDIFPDHEYIAKVKPFLEANGWKQTLPQGDAGHFEFQGVTEVEDTSELSVLKQEAKALGLSGKEADEFAKKRLDESFGKLTESQGKALKAVQVSSQESKLYDSLVEDIDQEDFADAINVISTTITDSSTPLTGELVNRLVVDPKIRRAITSEARWLGAILREESGAAISIDEYLTKGGAFFPRAGDDIDQILDKDRARKIESRSLRSKIGPAGERSLKEFFLEQEEEAKDIVNLSTQDFLSVPSKEKSNEDFFNSIDGTGNSFSSTRGVSGSF
jgi:hypothetical protein